MRTALAIIWLLCMGLCSWAWPPSVFCNGRFCSGFLAVGVSTNATPTTGGGGGAPADGYEANLYAYYAFEETSSPAVDSAHARNVSQSCGAVSTGHLTGFSGNAYQINCGASHSTPKVKLSRTDDGSGSFKFSSSFTVRFWIKTTINNAFDFKNLVGENTWNVYLDASGADGKIDFFISGNSNPDVDLLSNENVNDGQWHRVICWFDATGIGSAGVQIDNNAPATTSTVDIFVPGFSTSFFIGDDFNDAADVDADEVAVWKDYALTSDDRLFDWNSGAGQTHPLP